VDAEIHNWGKECVSYTEKFVRILANHMYGTVKSHQFRISSSSFHNSNWPSQNTIQFSYVTAMFHPYNYVVIHLNQIQSTLKMETVHSFKTSELTIYTAFKIPKSIYDFKIQNNLCEIVTADHLL
jgi:hypothetical protein